VHHGLESRQPQVYQLDGGEDTDPNAISFAAGYNKCDLGHRPVERGGPHQWDQQRRLHARRRRDCPGWDNTGPGHLPDGFTANTKINATVEPTTGSPMP